MDARIPLFRITIKELVLEIEDEEGVRNLGRSLSGLFAAAAPSPEPFSLALEDKERPARRGRPPKAVTATKPTRKRRRARADAATAQIRQLRTEGFFELPRRASEVKNALADRGHTLENRQIYATLKYMADANDLARVTEGDEGVYLYSAAHQ